MRLGDDAVIAELIANVTQLPPARATPLLRAGRARLRAELAHRSGQPGETEGFEREAVALLRSIGSRPMLAHALMDRARRHEDPEALAEARIICSELGAKHWLARIDSASGLAA
jgi:hypothetical protein